MILKERVEINNIYVGLLAPLDKCKHYTHYQFEKINIAFLFASLFGKFCLAMVMLTCSTLVKTSCRLCSTLSRSFKRLFDTG